MTCDSKELERAATKVVELCCAKGLTVSTAES